MLEKEALYDIGLKNPQRIEVQTILQVFQTLVNEVWKSSEQCITPTSKW
jgi:hypothetical protein